MNERVHFIRQIRKMFSYKIKCQECTKNTRFGVCVMLLGLLLERHEEGLAAQSSSRWQ